ncbi:MAG: YggS family pyridoxal phosphate-dependent enzyme [Candidatus Binataceae bacterium]|nr:YggS family pyridoxal phosphate-dependent enzyme [Candidatus Binataceae bacterium]
MPPAEEIEQRLHRIRERIADAARRAHRDSASIRLVVASKTQTPDAILAAYGAGAREFGENYVQEAVSKRARLNDLTDVQWHLIGHLQSNKARLAATAFTMIQSVDSESIARALGRVRPAMPVLIEINSGGETTKTGVAPDQAERLVDTIRAVVDVRGLMAIPPAGDNPETSRLQFAQLRELRDRLATATGLALSELSMGMTDDFEIAIEEGATIVRVGRAIFGERIT